VKICYCDETGTGNEPIAVTVGVVVDSQRMHITKEDWDDLLQHLSGIVGVRLDELHARDFYSGNSPFRGIAGPKRSEYISTIFQWFADRKHHFIHTAVDKNAFRSAVTMGALPPEIQTLWRCVGAYIILASQRAFQKIEKTKVIQSSFSIMSIARKSTSKNSYSNRQRGPIHIMSVAKSSVPWHTLLMFRTLRIPRT
jgi:hypothetical protein